MINFIAIDLMTVQDIPDYACLIFGSQCSFVRYTIYSTSYMSIMSSTFHASAKSRLATHIMFLTGLFVSSFITIGLLVNITVFSK